MINTKENQSKNMKPLKVLPLVLMALLLLVPAASAETYTFIDTDLVFGGGIDDSLGVSIPTYKLSEADFYNLNPVDGELSYGPQTLDYSAYVLYYGGSCLGSFSLGSIDVGRCYYGQTSTGLIYSECVAIAESFASSFSSANPDVLVIPYLSYISQLGGAYYGCYVLLSFGSDFGVTQHVTVTYSEESEKYTVTLERNDVLSSAAVIGKIFGWIPVVNPVDTSSEDWTLTLSPYFLWFGIDYELRVNLDGQTQSVSWNLKSLPLDVTPPEPGPPDDPPDEPGEDDIFDPEDPFPEYGSGSNSPSLLPERIPTSIKDLIGFSKEEILASFAAGIPFYSDALYFAADLFDFIFENILGVFLLVIGFFFDALYDMLDYLYVIITWIFTAIISFGQYFEIPNHILSRLVQILPTPLVNFALVVFGFDIFLNVLSIAVSDLIIAYRSTVYTYYHKVEHPATKGGKK